MTIKILFGSLSLIFATISFIPYIRDVLEKKTTPHIYSWLIWSILQGTAAAAILRENTLWSALGVLAVGVAALIVFILSFRLGTKNVTTIDTLSLLGAFFAILIWTYTQNVLASVVLITIIDIIGFFPTYRKAYEEPESETISLYAGNAISNLFSLLSITCYSIISSLYVVSLIITNTIFVIMVLSRRKEIIKP